MLKKAVKTINETILYHTQIFLIELLFPYSRSLKSPSLAGNEWWRSYGKSPLPKSESLHWLAIGFSSKFISSKHWLIPLNSIWPLIAGKCSFRFCQNPHNNCANFLTRFILTIFHSFWWARIGIYVNNGFRQWLSCLWVICAEIISRFVDYGHRCCTRFKWQSMPNTNINSRRPITSWANTTLVGFSWENNLDLWLDGSIYFADPWRNRPKFLSDVLNKNWNHGGSLWNFGNIW